MNRLFLGLVLVTGVALFTSPISAQEKKRPPKVIGIHTPNGWLLDVYADGSGYLQFGSNAQDGWKFKSGTLDVKQAEKDLKALTPDEKWLGAKSHAFWLASEAKPDKEVPARYSRDTKVITALLKKAMEATENRHTFDANRKTQLMKAHPLGELPELPKEK